MDAGISSDATAIAGDRSGEGRPLVILVDGAFDRRAIVAATARLARPLAVVRDDRGGRGSSGETAPSAAERAVKQVQALVGGAGSMVVVGAWPGGVLAGRRGQAVVPLLTGAAGLPAQAGRNVFRREGEYWTVSYQDSVVRLKDAKGLRHLARLLACPGREWHVADLEAAEGQPGGGGKVRGMTGTSSSAQITVVASGGVV